MLLQIALFEFRYFLRSPQTWVAFTVFFLMGSLAFGYLNGEGAIDTFRLGREVFINSPFYITVSLSLLGLLAFVIAPAIVGESVIKDTERRFDGILFSTPAGRASYLFGRFLGSFSALFIAFLGAPLGMLLSPYWTFSFPEGALAPFSLTTLAQFAGVILVYALPILLLLSGMVFTVALLARSVIYLYLFNLALVIFLLMGLGTAGRMGVLAPVLPYIDPTLLGTLYNLPIYYTPEQLNTTVISLNPQGTVMLLNRLVMLVGSALWLLLSYLLFSTRKRAGNTVVALPEEAANTADSPALSSGKGHSASVPWSGRTTLAQLWLRTRFEFRSVFLSLPFLLLVLVNLGFMANQYSSALAMSLPVTPIILNVLTGGLVGIFLLLVILIFSPEIIWREHKNKFHYIIDALPVPGPVFVISKLLALVGVLAALVLINIAVAMKFQYGNADIEVGLTLHRGFFYLLLPYLCFAALATFLQVASGNRFTGMVLTVGYLLVTAALFFFGFQHPLYQNFLAADDLLAYSDMNGSGRFMVRGYWLRAWWISITGIVLMLTYLLWNRGTLQPIRYRLHRLKQFRSRSYLLPACVCLLLMAGTGGTIFYNTNILNTYLSADELEELFAQYEKRYRQYENLPMPRITDITMAVDLFPAQKRIEYRAELTVQNKSGQVLDAIHLELPRGIAFESVAVPGGTLSGTDDEMRYSIYTLDTPMQPNENRTLTMQAHKQIRGFSAGAEDITLVGNGTYFEINSLIPHIGFSQDRLLLDRDTRTKYGLDPELPAGKLTDDPATSIYLNNAALRRDSDLVNFEVTLSTADTQTAVSSGRLLAQWQENGRRYFQYKTDEPVYPVIPFFSAEYEVMRDTWQDPQDASREPVDIEIYYHPTHTTHLALMMESLKHGLTYYSEAFWPYSYQQLRVMEYPGYRTNSRSLPTVIAHSEFNGFIRKLPETSYEKMAHELSHHWWGHRILAARIEGAGMLGEGLASYSARMLMEEKYGKDYYLHLQFVSPVRRYLRGRNSDTFGEKPLVQALGQTYLDYYKGEVIFYALQELLGTEVVNGALRRFMEAKGGNTPPYAVSTDLLTILKEEAGPESLTLIEDFFEKITLYDVAMQQATVEPLDDGRFKVTLVISTAKLYANEGGAESKAVFDGPVSIGLFTMHPRNLQFSSDENVILMQTIKPQDGESAIELIVDELPVFAGIDPYNVLIERNTVDNIGVVE